jgi:hypothetical protein
MVIHVQAEMFRQIAQSSLFRVPKLHTSCLGHDGIAAALIPPSREKMLALRGGREPVLDDAFLERNIEQGRRKRIRKALKVLNGPSVPQPAEMVRVGVEMAQRNIGMMLSALQQVGFDTNRILHAIATSTGAELVIPNSYAPAFVDRAHAFGITLTQPMAAKPATPEGRRTLLKRLDEATIKAGHANTRAFFAQWAAQVRQVAPETPTIDLNSNVHIERTHPPMEEGPVASSSYTVDLGCIDIEDDMADADGQLTDTSEINADEQCIGVDHFQEPTLPDATRVEVSPTSEPNHTDEHWLHITYLNVCGLSTEKLDTMSSRLQPNSLCFLAETWHIDEERRIGHPNMVATSIQVNPSLVSRGKGGLHAITHTSLKSNIRVIARAEYHITVAYGDLVIAAIYLPPSLSNERVRETLASLDARTDIVLGDFNAKLSGHCPPSETERAQTSASELCSRGMALKIPDSQVESSNLDHTVVRATVDTKEYHIMDAPISTDHPMLVISAKATGKHTKKGSARYNITSLNSEAKIQSFVKLADILCSSMVANIRPIRRLAQEHEIVAYIETLDSVLLFIIQYSLECTAGVYAPSNNRSLVSHAKPGCLDLIEATRTIRLAKREDNTNKELFALDANLTPEQEAEKHIAGIYSSTSATGDHAEWSTDNLSECPSLEVEQVIEAIKSYPEGKAPGNDGIDRRALMMLTKAPTTMICLTRLYAQCMQWEITPARWNHSVITPIPKQGKDPRYIANRRPISLTVLFRRIFERLILPDIVYQTKLNHGQAGFRTGFSCATQLLLAEQARHNGQRIRVFLDLKAAYDSVPINRLLVKMGKKNIARYLIRLVESLQCNCFSQVAVNGGLTDPIPLKRGLFQGSILSPILFDIYIDDLADELNTAGAYSVPTCLLFADDIMLNTADALTMQQHLDTVTIWCSQNKMELNIGKCGTFVSGTGLMANGEYIPIVDTYSYLGVALSQEGICLDLLMENNYRKTLGAFMAVKNSLSSRTWPPAIKINIYKMYIRSVMEYGAPMLILSLSLKTNPAIKAGLKKLQNLQNDCIRWAIGRKRAIVAMESMAGLTPVTLRLAELTARLRLHLESASGENPTKTWLTHNNACPLLRAAGCYPIPEDRKVETIKTLYRSKAAEQARQQSTMAQYISPECRLDNGMDACLTIQSPLTRKLAIAWRCNGLGVYQMCKTCNEPFTRRHIECIDIGIYGDMAGECRALALSGTRGPLYTILDHALNTRKYHLFSKGIVALIANLQ